MKKFLVLITLTLGASAWANEPTHCNAYSSNEDGQYCYEGVLKTPTQTIYLKPQLRFSGTWKRAYMASNEGLTGPLLCEKLGHERSGEVTGVLKAFYDEYIAHMAQNGEIETVTVGDDSDNQANLYIATLACAKKE